MKQKTEIKKLKKKKGHKQPPPLVVNTEENNEENEVDNQSDEPDFRAKPIRLRRKKEPRPYRPKRPASKRKPSQSEK